MASMIRSRITRDIGDAGVTMKGVVESHINISFYKFVGISFGDDPAIESCGGVTHIAVPI